MVIKSFMILVVLTFLWTFSRGETEVFCVFGENCILPCEFQTSSDPVIHWIYMTTGGPRVHSYYNSQDQLDLQDQRFTNRTSLFQDQFSRGNASLLLRGVRVQDQGAYGCHTSTNRGSKRIFINLKIDEKPHPAADMTGKWIRFIIASPMIIVAIGLVILACHLIFK